MKQVAATKANIAATDKVTFFDTLVLAKGQWRRLGAGRSLLKQNGQSIGEV